MPTPTTTFGDLPDADPLTGTEGVPMWQGGKAVKAPLSALPTGELIVGDPETQDAIVLLKGLGGSNGVTIQALGVDADIDVDISTVGAGVLRTRSIRVAAPIFFQSYAFSDLPPAADNRDGRAFCYDSSVTTFGSNVAGGGGSYVPVYCDGTHWIVG